MKKGDPYLEQVEKHRQKIERVRTETGEPAKLPPRSRVHQNKKQKTSLKLKYPVIRLLVLFFILLPLTVFAVISSLEGNKSAGSTEKGGIETVNFEDNDQNEEVQTSPDEETSKEQDQDEGASEPETSREDSEKEETPVLSGSTASSEGKDSPANESAPDKESSVSHGANPEGNNSQDSGASHESVKYHTVKPGETLFRIAMMYFKSQDGIGKIREANGIVENEIKVGQTLKIPMN
ncbi:hypothetical protein DRW41_20665 [Neobacillus piezotolerans]|uniref:LysM domain-containing protein n=1 Tax=Neobacillus piezotolerans TaxID=2259171 RepID=A0A3D8GL11_9BACI|nr:LysM peptidoglycan-binding domain-containing protein [Neobacillus piezotolerans]RDU35031.1 hypothetical protein DRW41_20665 [Neobacillus piezotolerans]